MPPVWAVDCGGTRLRIAVMEGETPAPMERVAVLPTPDELAGLPDALLAAMPVGPAVALGVGVAGLVAAGVVHWMPHRPGGPIALREVLERAIGVPVAVDNDANLAGLAEARCGAGSGHRAVLMVTVGTGIGGALLIDGELERGRGFLGEIGHLPFDPAGGSCACGLTGCWEVAASGRALDRAAVRLAAADPRGDIAALLGPNPAGADLVAAAGLGNGQARQAVAEVGAAFGRGLGALVSAFDPDVIVVGGGVAAADDLFLQPARRAMMAATSGGSARRETPVVAARFGDGAGLVGAALAAREVAP